MDDAIKNAEELMRNAFSSLRNRKDGVKEGDRRSLSTASLFDDVKSVERILDTSSLSHEDIEVALLDTDQFGDSALHLASREESLRVLTFLLSLPLSARVLNQVNALGATPLALAAERGHSSVCRLLLEAGADATLTDVNEMSPLHLAAHCPSNDACISMLIESTPALLSIGNDASIGIIAKSPLHCAASVGATSNCRVLASSAPDLVNLQESDYLATPLMLAVVNGHFECVKMLVEEANSRLDLKNLYGDSAFAIVEKQIDGDEENELYQYLKEQEMNVVSSDQVIHTPIMSDIADELEEKDVEEKLEERVQEEEVACPQTWRDMATRCKFKPTKREQEYLNSLMIQDI